MKIFRIAILISIIVLPALGIASVPDKLLPEKPIIDDEIGGEIILYNTDTDELMEINYKNKNEYIDKDIDGVNYILRCASLSRQALLTIIQ